LVAAHRLNASSTFGVLLRAFTFGRFRRFDLVLDTALARAWLAGASPGAGPLVTDLDSFVSKVHGYPGGLRLRVHVRLRLPPAGGGPWFPA
jgi:hypothetical protein